MLIQSSLPNSISTELCFATDHGQLNTDSSCDWSNCCGTWQKSLKLDECPLHSSKEALSTGEEERKLSSIGIVELSRTCSGLSAMNDMCASSVPKRDGHVYKRRKLQRNTVALPEGSATESTKRSSSYHSIVSSIDHSLNVDLGRAPSTIIDSCDTLDNGTALISRSHHLEKTSNGFCSQISDNRNSESVQKVLPYVGEDKVPAESSLNILRKSASAHSSGVNDSCSSSRSNIGHDSTSIKEEVEEVGECSTSDIVVAELLGKFTSVKDLCISVLKSHGLLGGAWTSGACASLEVTGVADPNSSQSCKICGRLENPLEMLICDLCEESFHMSCCNPRVKKPPQVDEWYCRSCLRKNPNCVRKNCTGKSSEDSEMSKHRNNMSHEDLGPIVYMLRDNEPYTSRVRIGIDFQAEVPDWSGPVSDDYNYFYEPMELDPADCATTNGWNFNKPPTIGNWIQCREVTYKDGNDNEGIVCGKWRRAPLSEVQTDDWDCSCAVLWDAIHSDCAVPQELETDIVLKHLKYVEKWRSLLANKQKNDQSRSYVPNQTRRVGPD